LGVVFGSWLAGPALGAEEPPGSIQPLQVQYEAPASCPDATSFFLQVRARTQRVRLAEPGEAARVVSVRIESTPEGSRGALGVPTESAEPFVREVRAGTCDEVVLALSLVLALAYDPDARVTFEEPAPQPAPAPVEPAPPPQPTPRATPPTVEAEPPLRFAVGGAATLMTGFAPGWSPVLGPFVEVSDRDESALLSPRVRATLWIGPENEIDVGERTATLGLLAGRLEGCPVGVLLGPDVRAEPCLALDAGRIAAAGRDGVDPSISRNRPWFAAWALLSVRYRPLPVLFVEALAGLGVPFVTDDFVLEGPRETVHTAPDGVGQVGLGLGVSFP